jgi:adenine-specific DNA-methyltransferase
MDEVFGRSNYVVTLYIQVRYAEKTLKQDMAFHKQVEQIHVYRKEYGALPNQNIKDMSFEKFCYHVVEVGKAKDIILGGKLVSVFPSGHWKVESRGVVNGAKGNMGNRLYPRWKFFGTLLQRLPNRAG